MTDVSKKTLALLLIVAVVISVLGTWTVLNSGPNLRVQGSSGYAKVSYDIGNKVPHQQTKGAVTQSKANTAYSIV